MMYTGLCVGIFAMLFYTPVLLALGVNKVTYPDYPLTAGEFICCCIPIFNVIRAEKQWYGKLFLNFFSILAAIVFTALRVFTYIQMRDNVVVCQISVMLFVVAWLFLFIANMLFVWNVLTTCDAMTTFKRVLFSVFYPFGQFFIGKYLSTVIRNSTKLASTYESEYDEEDDSYVE